MVPAVRRYVFIAPRGRDAWVFGRATPVLVFFHLVRRLWKRGNTHDGSEKEPETRIEFWKVTLVNLALWSSFGPSRVLQRGREGKQLPPQHHTNSHRTGDGTTLDTKQSYASSPYVHCSAAHGSTIDNRHHRSIIYGCTEQLFTYLSKCCLLMFLASLSNRVRQRCTLGIGFVSSIEAHRGTSSLATLPGVTIVLSQNVYAL